MKIVSKDNPLPLHYQMKEILLEMIENEELKPDDMIPTERELCEIQNVSRMTVNKAILSLVNEGVLYREQGRGTFVSKPKEKQQLSKLRGFTDDMSQKGFQTNTKILSFKLVKPTKKTRLMLKMNENQENVIELTRLRMREEEPVALETVWIPQYLCENMTIETIKGKSLYKVIEEEYGHKLVKADQTIEPVQLNGDESDLLHQKNGALALLFRRTTYIENGIPIEYTKTIYRSDIYKYEITLT